MSFKIPARLFIVFSALLSQYSWSLNLTGYQFTDSYRYSLLTDSLQEKFGGSYVATASYGYLHSPLFYSDKYLHDKQKVVIDSHHILTTGLTFYASQNIALGAEFTGIHNTVFNDTHTTFGDTTLRGKFNLRRRKGFSLSLNPHVVIPTGETDNFTSQGSVGAGLNLVAEKSFARRFHILGSLGAQSSKNNRYAQIDHRQLLMSQLGFSYDVSEKLNVNLESFRNLPLVKDNYQDDGKYFVTAKHKTGKSYSTYAGVGTTGLKESTIETYSAFVGIKFSEAVAKEQQIHIQASAPERVLIPAPFKNIYFAHDRSHLTMSEQNKLDDYVYYLKHSPDFSGSILIQGFSSQKGSSLYNKKLSQRRAQTVKSYFTQQGVPEDKISIEGLGEDFPQNRNEALNRKVIINLNQEG